MSPYCIHDAGLDQNNKKIGFNLLFLTFGCITNQSPEYFEGSVCANMQTHVQASDTASTRCLNNKLH